MMATYNNQEVCTLCINGVPGIGHKSCQKFPQNDPDEFDNCLYGYRNNMTDDLTCYKCQQGYTKLPKFRMSPSKKVCLPEWKGKLGCQEIFFGPADGAYCKQCDELRNYHFDGKGRGCVTG